MVFQATLTEIEAALNQICPGKWRRLLTEELRSDPLYLFQAGWRIDLNAEAVQAPGVDHLVLAIDASFPSSQPRVLAPSLSSDYRWPHVEAHGLLCLRATSIVASTADRIAIHLHDALELLNLPQDKRAAEFEREFGSYWTHQSLHPNKRPCILSLVKPGGPSRQVVFFFDNRLLRILVADTKAEATAWLRNAGTQVGDRDLLPGLLVCLPRPWHPDEFPQTFGDTVRDLPEESVHATLLPNRKSLFLFEATTTTGPVFAAVLANGAKSDKLKNGFRSWAQVPIEHIKRAMAYQKVERVVVSRVDAPWVHGRGHSHELPDLRSRKVAIVGCGAIGSEVAELLAKAGVGELALVDDDNLYSANVGRHLLGIGYIGWSKAKGVATELQRRLPHLAIGGIYPKKFEWLMPTELRKLATMDMVVTAGLDIEGEAVVNAWRQTLEQPPAYLSTWVEAYATAGHAVLLYGKTDLMAGFEGEHPAFRLTDWPAGAGQMITEAGCGNVFQPHGVVDLQPTITMAAKMALDALLGRVPDSCRRVWFGDRDVVGALGGVAREAFKETNAMRQFPW
jgi:hypothetical protein